GDRDMTARELIAQLQGKGVELKSSGDRLVIDAPKGAITPEVRSALAEHKAELLTILNTPSVANAPAVASVAFAPTAPPVVAPPVVTSPPEESFVAPVIRPLAEPPAPTEPR